MLRRTLAFSAVLAVALAFPAERGTSPPDVQVLTQPVAAPTIDIVSLLLPSVAIAQAPTAVADTTVQTERHSHGVIFWGALVVVAVLVGVASWRFSKRGSDTGGYGGGSQSSGSGSSNKRAT